MPNAKKIHVVRDGQSWAARREGSDRASAVEATQGAAIDAARRIALREHGEVVNHGLDGKIRDRDSYGADPFPPRDRKH